MALDLKKNDPKAPPRKATPNTKTPATTPAGDATRIAVREEGVKGLFDLGAGVALMLRSPADAGACVVHGPKVSYEVAVFAEQDEKIGALVDKLTALGPYAALFSAILPFGIQIAVNHGALQPGMFAQFGVMTPEALQARAAAEALQQQAELMRQQAQAEADYAAATQEMAQAAQQLNDVRTEQGDAAA